MFFNLIFSVYFSIGMGYTFFHYGEAFIEFTLFKLIFSVMAWPFILIASNLMISFIILLFVFVGFLFWYYLSWNEWKTFFKDTFSKFKKIKE